MRKYFLHLLKKNLLPLAIFTLFGIVLYAVPIMAQDYSAWNNGTRNWVTLYHNNITTALAILSVFIPLFLFRYRMNKRSVDMHYALPISKTKILVANFLMGLLLLYVSYTVSYLLGFFVVLIKVRRLHLIFYLYLYLASLVPAFISYSVTTFLCTRANTIVDGVFTVAGGLCILALAVEVPCSLFYPHSSVLRAMDGSWFFSFTPLVRASIVLGGALDDGIVTHLFSSSMQRDVVADMCMLVGSTLWLLLGIGATVGLILSEKRSKAENCGQVSNSPFCYKVQLPIYTVLFSALACDSGNMSPLPLALVVFAVFIMAIVYKRSVKIGWKFAVVLAACVVGGACLYAIPEAIFFALENIGIVFI